MDLYSGEWCWGGGAMEMERAMFGFFKMTLVGTSGCANISKNKYKLTQMNLDGLK